MRLGDYLRNLRKEKELSLRELQKEVGISHNTLGSYERNTAQPTVENIYKLCRYFKVPVEYLFLGEDSLKNFRDIDLLALFNKVDRLEEEDRDIIKKYILKYVHSKKELDRLKKEAD